MTKEEIQELREEINARFGENVQVKQAKIYTTMSEDALEDLYRGHIEYPDDVKVFIRKYIPSGLSVQFYVAIVHLQRMITSWLPLSLEIVQIASMVTTRVGYIVRNMSPTDKRQFCLLFNSLNKHIIDGEELPTIDRD